MWENIKQEHSKHGTLILVVKPEVGFGRCEGFLLTKYKILQTCIVMLHRNFFYLFFHKHLAKIDIDLS